MVYAGNSALIFTNNLFSGDLRWYEGNDASQLVAYYPYASEGAPTSFSVAADQSTTGYAASDLMAASKSGVTPTDKAVSMSFKRMFAKIAVNVTNQSGSDISAVTLKNSVTTANVDLADLSVTLPATPATADIKANILTANTSYRGILTPQTVALILEVSLSGGKTLSHTLSSTVLEQGGEYDINIHVTSDGIEVSTEDHIIYGGDTYRIVTLANGTTWMAEPLRYVPAGYTPSADPTADSHIWYPYSTDVTDCVALTDDAFVAANGYFYDFYAAFGGVELTEANCGSFEGVQGICPNGWHIPTRAEYYALCGNSNKAASGETGQQVDDTALFFNSDYSSGSVSLFNDGGFNYVLSGARMQSNFAAIPAY